MMHLTDKQDNVFQVNPSAILWMGYSSQWQQIGFANYVIHLLGGTNILLKDDIPICQLLHDYSLIERGFSQIQLTPIESIWLNRESVVFCKEDTNAPETAYRIRLVDGTELSSEQPFSIAD